jgi:hypothetical protein
MATEYRGGAMDYSLSGYALDAIESLARGCEDRAEVDVFTEQLRALVARYRLERQARDTETPNAEVLARVLRIASHAEALRAELADLPAHAEALVTEHGYKVGRDDLLGELDRDLFTLARMLMMAGRDVSQVETRPGPPPEYLEDALLAEVAGMVEPFYDGAKELSAWRAAEILRWAGVHGLPNSGKKARERIRKWEKRTTRS